MDGLKDEFPFFRIMQRFHKSSLDFLASSWVHRSVAGYDTSPKLRNLLLEFKIIDLKSYFFYDMYELMKILCCKEVRYISGAMLQQLVLELERLEFIHNVS